MPSGKKRVSISAKRLYSTLVESSDDIVFVVARDGRYLMFNKRGLKNFGFRNKDVEGKRPSEALGEMGRRFERNNEQVFNSGKPLLLQEWLELPVGRKCLLTSLTPICNSKGAVEALIGVVKDVTEIKVVQEGREIHAERVEALLMERVHSEQIVKDIIREAIPRRPVDFFLESAVRIVGEGLNVSRSYIFEYDPFRKSVTCTHEWVSSGILPTKDSMNNVPVSAQPWWAQEMFAGRIVCIEDVSKTESPELKALLSSQGVESILAIPINTFGKAYGFLGFEQCSAKRKWEQMDIELLDAVSRVISQKIERSRIEEDMLGAERLAAIGRLTASFTHEINNPLQSVILHLDGLLDYLNPDGKRHYDAVTEGVKRVSDIVSRLLNVHRGARHVSEVDLNATLKEAYDLVAHQIDIKGINVRWQMEKKLPVVLADEKGLHQVFLNILLNACDSMEKGGELNLSSSVEGKNIVIEVQDSGFGIDEESLPFIFEPFYTTKGKSGTGLGLFVSHSIITDHGGKIEVSSKKGEGTTVRMLLPTKNGQ